MRENLTSGVCKQQRRRPALISAFVSRLMKIIISRVPGHFGPFQNRSMSNSAQAGFQHCQRDYILLKYKRDIKLLRKILKQEKFTNH